MTFKRRRGLTEQAATAAVDQACRMLRLPAIRAQLPELAEAAARDQLSYRGQLLLACGVAAGPLFTATYVRTGAIRADYKPLRPPSVRSPSVPLGGRRLSVSSVRVRCRWPSPWACGVPGSHPGARY